MVKIGIIGATGYTGLELVRIISQHPNAEVAFATSETYSGKLLSDVYPCPYHLPLVPQAEANLTDVDVIFLCTPHGFSAQKAVDILEKSPSTKVIDLSADFRFDDLETYKKWYGVEHPSAELAKSAVYGLPEINRADVNPNYPSVSPHKVIGNPGCYPTSVLLALMPLLRNGWVTGERIIIDTKSGVSGAGAQPKTDTHFVTVNGNFSAYKPGFSHRHAPEIEQEINKLSNIKHRITFTPHLLPVTRGILSTIYITAKPEYKAKDVEHLYRDTYGKEPFAMVMPEGKTASLAHVVNSNRFAVSVADAGAPGELILVSTIDNLIKGASGQAVQNMNILFGFNETDGLL